MHDDTLIIIRVSSCMDYWSDEEEVFRSVGCYYSYDSSINMIFQTNNFSSRFSTAEISDRNKAKQ